MALTVFKTVRDLTTSGWVGSIPMHSRQLARIRSPFRDEMKILRYPLLLRLALALSVAAPAVVSAQQPPPDTARRAPTIATSPAVDSLRPPLTPRRAFFYSFLAPGYSQSVLGRHKAATTFILVEAITIAMIRESGADTHEARRLVNDTVVVSYVDASGTSGVVAVPPQFGDAEVHTRASRIEDWVALLVANHLFAGADAFVAANLWDVPAKLGLRMVPHGAVLSASLKW